MTTYSEERMELMFWKNEAYDAGDRIKAIRIQRVMFNLEQRHKKAKQVVDGNRYRFTYDS